MVLVRYSAWRTISRLVPTILLCCSCFLCVYGNCTEKLRSENSYRTGQSIGGILGPLLLGARSTRENIFDQELPYDVIRKEISEV